MKDNEVKKDRHCIGCTRFWVCPGKPHRNACVNKIENNQK
jgi:hypothetical protein